MYYGEPKSGAHQKYSIEGISIYVPLRLDFTKHMTLDYISHFGVKKLVIDFIME